MGLNRLRPALVCLTIALVPAALGALPALDPLRGLSLDILTALRWQFFGNEPAPSAAVVVALDEETFNRPPFDGTPSITWTRQIGEVLSAISDGGAKVVGFDIVFPTSIEQSAIPFGDTTLGERVHGFDRDYLRALALGARAGKVVLGEVQHQDRPVLPSPGQRAAVGFGRNIRALNAYSDSDGVIRRMPLSFVVDGETAPSMAAELVLRATGAKAVPAETATRGAVPHTITLNFKGGADDIPTYSFADLYACLDRGDRDFFRREFEGKVVLIGTLLDVEDRKITSKRFATAPESARAQRCVLPQSPDQPQFTRESIAGVYIHATAVNNLVAGNSIFEFGRMANAIFCFGLGLLATAAAMTFGPATASLVTLGLAAIWTVGATFAFRHAVALPLIEPLLATVVCLGAAVAYRFVVADKSKRLLRQSFAFYLTPAVIEKMLASNKPPALGGEMRDVTVYFSDVADFSSIAEKIAPDELVAAMNEYLSAMTDIIEAHGGFVDKYIGDAIVAVFGAPLDDIDHATHAVRAALQCATRAAELSGSAGGVWRQRIGLASGQALVGNIGSHRRFNYTAMGDTVNLASRLEGANKFLGTTILASEATMIATGSAFLWREIDAVRVKGREQVVKVYEPLAAAADATTEQRSRAACYAEALARFRARDFATAAEAFARLEGTDAAATLFMARAKELARCPPGADWTVVNALEEK
jgi:class 3 adenylate cyclase/CHASE2 domain-containing sensor protein